MNTDDPAMFGSDLGTEHQAALSIGASALDCYLAGVRGALCDPGTRAEIARRGAEFDWTACATSPE